MDYTAAAARKIGLPRANPRGRLTQYWLLGAGALGQPRGMIWGGRREEGSGWGFKRTFKKFS